MKRFLCLMASVLAFALPARAQTFTVVTDSAGKVVAHTNLNFGKTVWWNAPNSIGLQLNRLSSGQVGLISSLTNGMVYYNTTMEDFVFRKNGGWVALGGLGGGGGGSGTYVNGALVNPANFTNSAQYGGWSVSGSNITVFSTNAPFLNGTNTYSGVNSLTNTGNVISGNGAGLTALNASSLASGSVADARIPSTITRDSEWDTVAKIEAIVGNNILTTNEAPDLQIASPGASLYYGTSAGGTKGYHALPAGTVSSVGMTVPVQFSVSGSPVTGSGTLAVTLTNSTGSGAVVLSNAPSILNAILTTPTISGRLVYGNIPTNTAVLGQVLKFDGTDFVPQNDSTGGAGSLYVNGSPISDANLTNTATAVLSIGSSTNIGVNPTNLANAQISASAAIAKSKISSSGAWTAAELGSGTADDNGFLRGDQTWVRSATDGEVPRISGGALVFGAIDLANGNSVIGPLADGNLSGNVAFLNGTNVFTGTNNFTLPTILTNLGNTISGNGVGLTNLNASNLASGSVPIARIGDDTLTVAKMADGDWGAFTISGNVATLDANSVALGTGTTGNYVLDVADGTGIDGTASGEGATYTPILDLTETTNIVWSTGNSTALTNTFAVVGADPVEIVSVSGWQFSTNLTVMGSGAFTNEVTAQSITASNSVTLLGTGAASLVLGTVTLADDQDGALSITANGDGNDENLTINLDDTANTAVVSSTTGLNSINFGSIGLVANLTGNADTATTAANSTIVAGTDTTSFFVVVDSATGGQPLKTATTSATINANTGDAGFTTVDIANADTTLSRASAGNVAVEGNLIYRAGGTDVPVADGGTGNSTLSQGAVLLGNGTSAIAGVTTSSTNVFLSGRADGSGNPAFRQVELTADVAGVLPVANGGNGAILRSFDIPMGAWMTNGLAVPATLTSWTNMGDAYLFPDTTTNGIYFRTSLSTNWNAGTISLMFKTGSTTTNNTSNTNCVWGARATTVQGGQEDAPTWGTEVTATNHIHKSPYFSGYVVTPPLTVGNTPAANKDFVIQLRRIPTDATDVNTNTLSMLNVTLFYIETATKQTALPLATN